eukprot:m.47293 g.47293  ORF g.47293 m.47293 type:complete len:279 (+) comp47531_c0_seq4:1279-2115(+)
MATRSFREVTTLQSRFGISHSLPVGPRAAAAPQSPDTAIRFDVCKLTRPKLFLAAMIAVCVSGTSRQVFQGTLSHRVSCFLRFIFWLASGQCLAVMRGHRAAVLSLYFDEDRVVSAGMDMEIRVWDFEGACRMTLSGHQSGISSVQFDARFNVIFSGAFDGELRFWDLNTGELLETIDWIHSEGHRQAIRFVPFGSLSLCIEQKYSLRLISRNLQTNAHRIITASDDKTMKVWDIQTRRRLLTIKCHDDGVTCLSFNDRYIVSGSFDETVRLLDFGAC